MDIRSYSGASTSQAANSSDSEDSRPDSSDPESSRPSPSPSPPPSKKACSMRSKCHLTETTKRKYSNSWEDYSWLYYDKDREGAFCKVCKQFGTSSRAQRSGEVWITKSFKNWKKAVEKLKAHARSDSHSQATATLLAVKRAAKDGTVVQQLQNVEAQKRAQNRTALKCLILLTHFLTKEHVANLRSWLCGGAMWQTTFEAIPRNCSKKCFVHIKSGCG